MNPASELLSELKSLGVELAANGNRLHVRAPAGVVDYSLRERLTKAKPDLLRLLAPALVWRVTIDGKGITAIDPDRCSIDEMRRRLGLKFGPSRVGPVELQESAPRALSRCNYQR